MDPDGQWLDFKVFIYAGGRTTRWCGEPTAGPRIAVSGPGGGAVITRPWMGLIGDETALPMIARMLEAAPRDTMGEAVVFIPDAADAQPMRVPPGVRLRRALRGSGATPLRRCAPCPSRPTSVSSFWRANAARPRRRETE